MSDKPIPTIQDQIELEKRMVAYGISRYRHSINSAEDNGRGADTQYAQKLMHEFIMPVSDAIKNFCNTKTGSKAKYGKLLQVVEADKAAYFGLRAVFNHFIKEEPFAALAIQIGTMIEDEAKFQVFQLQHGDYYNTIIRDFKKKGTVNYRHMHRVLTMKAKQNGITWNNWSTSERAAVGTKVVDCILESTDLIEKSSNRKNRKKNRSPQTIIRATPAALEWVRNFNQYAEMLNPDRVPCIIPPDPWVSFEQGGYYTPQLRRRSPLVKTRSMKQQDLLKGDIENITTAVNLLQDTAWKINERINDVLNEVWNQSLPIGLPSSEPYLIPDCPIEKTVKKQNMTEAQREAFEEWKCEARTVHTMERERVSKCFQVIRVLRLANEFKEYDKFWYVYQCDFRGRMYATVSGLSPQGADYAKALLLFAEGKPLTERGAYWLAVHCANTYGYDKVSYNDRVKWVQSNRKQIIACADDPLSHKDFWGNADKPWQFLAACFEYARFKKEGIGMLSHLPIGLDGSCNGLQNFSAMLHDEIGGKATNLMPGKVPSDIYSEVAAVCTKRIHALSHEEECEERDLWIAFSKKHGGIPRNCVKKPVMTLPYGSTQQSCREYIYKWILEEAGDEFPKEKRFKCSVFLTPILWKSIAEVVVAARKAMDWIQKCASITSKEGHPLIWWTPIGFPVYQERKKIITRQIHTELAGHFKLRIGEVGDTLDVLGQKLGSSPNFVHSMDACHLMMTLHRAGAAGITSFACIHDDYGTHAADTDLLHIAIREAFVELYLDNDPLMDFKIVNESHSGLTLPPVPEKGKLSIGKIKDSLYFFG